MVHKTIKKAKGEVEEENRYYVCSIGENVIAVRYRECKKTIAINQEISCKIRHIFMCVKNIILSFC